MKKWTLINTSKPQGSINTDSFGIDEKIAQIMINRGINSKEDIEMYISPDIYKLRDPFLLKDMDKAYKRIKLAIENNEKICVYGDYDVDGVSSTSLLMLYFDFIGYEVMYYIPNRLEEGYGLNIEAIEYLASKDIDLIITVDCGITSIKEVDFANEKGIDVIVTDHHECQLDLPNAVAVIDPKREDCTYPFKGICGCGVSLKLIHALSGEDFYKNIHRYLEIVALATICDVMPILDENRIIVKNGMAMMGSGNNLGMKALIQVCGLDEKQMRSSHLGFQIGPRINAAGRLGYSYLGVELFTSKNMSDAKMIAEEMDIKNQSRQTIESEIHVEVEESIIKYGFDKDKVIIVSGKNWHHGIIGIVASKITEKYYKPCILLCEEGDVATGSARSIKGFDIFNAMYECKDLMEKFGGHEQAAGLTIKIENIDLLRKKINEIADYTLEEEDLIEEIKIEYEINPRDISLDLVSKLHLLEPFGIKNPTPYFMMRNCLVKSAFKMGKEKNHLKLVLWNEEEFECVGFSMAYLLEKFDVNDYVDIVFQIDENTFNSVTKVQLLIKDIRVNRRERIIDDNKNLKKLSDLLGLDNLSKYRYGVDNKKSQLEFIKSMNKSFYIESDEYNEPSRIEDIISKFEDNTLVIVNTVGGYYRALSDMYTDQDKKIDLIFLSNIDKNDFKVYNKIIVYDFFDNNLEIEKLISKWNKNEKIVINFGVSDYVYLNNKFRETEFDREEFATIYKYILSYDKMLNKKQVVNNSSTNDKIELDHKNYINENIEHKKYDNVLEYKKMLYECNISFYKADIIFRVLEDEKLIDYNLDLDNNIIYYSLLPRPKEKLDLSKNDIIQFLNSKI